MSTIKRRLEDALEQGHQIEKEQRSEQVIKSSLQITAQHDVKVGDENGIYAITLKQDGSQAAIGLGSGSFMLFNCKSNNDWEKVRRIRTDLAVSLPLLALKFYPCQMHNAIYTGGSDGLIKVWNLETFGHGERTVEEKDNQITSLDFSNDGYYFATGGKDCSIRVYNSDSLTLFKEYNGANTLNVDSSEDLALTPGHSQKVFAVKFHSEDRNVFISASWDHSVKIWDLRTDCSVRTVHGPFVCGDGIDILNGKILTASWLAQGALQIWDYGSGEVIKDLTWPTVDRRGEFLYCARFWDVSHVVAGGSGTNDLKLINVENDKVVGTISGDDHPVQAVEVMESRKLLTCGTSSNLLRNATIDEIEV